MIIRLRAVDMIISKTPLRMSFVGGGSDLPAFYLHHPGAVITTAINKYVYVAVNKKFDDGIRVAYSVNEEVYSVSDLQHNLVRAVLSKSKITGGIEIVTVADIPSRGTGLGSSSSFTVGLLNAIYAYQEISSCSKSLADDSCHIEIDVCKEPIGRQDQFAAAFGGFRFMQFLPDHSVEVSDVECGSHTICDIESHILLFYTGIVRSASQILHEQSLGITSDVKKRNALIKMVSLVYDLKYALENDDLDVFGEILHENWLLKKSLAAGISTSDIDDWYTVARKEGAIGGKILGAGAGGFLMLYAPPERHEAIKRALFFLKSVDVKFEKNGSRIVFGS